MAKMRLFLIVFKLCEINHSTTKNALCHAKITVTPFSVVTFAAFYVAAINVMISELTFQYSHTFFASYATLFT